MANDKSKRDTENTQNLNSSEESISDELADLKALLKEHAQINEELPDNLGEFESLPGDEFANFDNDAIEQDSCPVEDSLNEENQQNSAITLKLMAADILSEKFPSIQALKFMSEELDKRSNGRISMKLFSDGAFGTETEALEQTAEGTLDMARVNISCFNEKYPETIVPTLPSVFSSMQHMHDAIDGEPGQDILHSISGEDYIGLALYDSGARNMYTNKPIKNMADMQGLKIRILPSPHNKALLENMGAITVALPLDEVEFELHNGVIDGAENNIFSYQGLEHYRECKYYSLTEHIIAPDILVFSKKRWQTISPEDQAIILDAAKASAIASRDFCQQSEQLAIQAAESEGAVIVKDIDKASFDEANNSIYNKFVITPKQKALLAKIKAIK